jgi:hypothetical protein
MSREVPLGPSVMSGFPASRGDLLLADPVLEEQKGVRTRGADQANRPAAIANPAAGTRFAMKSLITFLAVLAFVVAVFLGSQTLLGMSTPNEKAAVAAITIAALVVAYWPLRRKITHWLSGTR